jgi:hypothetical protein
VNRAAVIKMPSQARNRKRIRHRSLESRTKNSVSAGFDPSLPMSAYEDYSIISAHGNLDGIAVGAYFFAMRITSWNLLNRCPVPTLANSLHRSQRR